MIIRIFILDSYFVCALCAVYHPVFMYMYMFLTDKLDGDQDSFGYDLALVETLSLSVTTWRNGTSSNVLFTGEASDTNYTQVNTLRLWYKYSQSLYYINWVSQPLDSTFSCT